jgi:hypothetical protein
MLGEIPARSTVTGATIITAVNLLLAIWVFSRARSRIPYWVS